MIIIACLEIVAGAALLIFTKDKAALTLAYILILIGISYFLWREEISFELDHHRRMIHWKKKRLLKRTKKDIPFSDVEQVFSSAFHEYYIVNIKLKSGEILSLGKRFSTEEESQSLVLLFSRQIGLQAPSRNL